jgi:hypothetical protein
MFQHGGDHGGTMATQARRERLSGQWPFTLPGAFGHVFKSRWKIYV